jgi:hypothetical protein
MIDILITILINAIVILSIILICFGLYLSYCRHKEGIHRKRKDLYIGNRSNEWFCYLTGNAPFKSSLIPMNTDEIKAIEEIFISYTNNFSDPNIQERIKEFSNLYLNEYYRSLLQSRKWSIRMNAMYRIVDFQLESLIDECEKFKGRKLISQEYFQLLKIYSIFNRDQFINKLVTLPYIFSEYEYKKLFSNIHVEVIGDLIKYIDDFPTTCQYAIIETLGIDLDLEHIPILESLLEHENTEIRIRTLKAIYEIGVIIDIEKYIRFVKSTIWEERLMMAKLLGNLPLSYTWPYLEELLKDNSWWVRSQAAQTIGKVRFGREKLKEFIEKTDDQYAIDMAEQILEKGSSNI